MDIQKRVLSDGTNRWRVRWRESGRGSRYRARTFDRKSDAVMFAAEVHRRRQLGSLRALDGGRITLAEYVSGTWARAYRQNLSASTRMRYGYLYDKHVLPELGSLMLAELTPEVIAGWQADRISAGSGPVAVRSALTLLGGILRRAVEAGHIPTNPARAVRKASLPRRAEVGPLAPSTIERMRRAS